MGWLGWLTVPVAPKETENSRDRDVTLCIKVFTKLREEKKGVGDHFLLRQPRPGRGGQGKFAEFAFKFRKSSELLYFPLY